MNCYADVKNCVRVIPCLLGCCIFCLYRPVCEMRCVKIIEPDPKRLPETHEVKNKDILLIDDDMPLEKIAAYLELLKSKAIRTITIMRKDYLKEEKR